jgi:hypothetical protein
VVYDVYHFVVDRLVSPLFCTEVLHWPADTCIFVCKHLDGLMGLYIYMSIPI